MNTSHFQSIRRIVWATLALVLLLGAPALSQVASAATVTHAGATVATHTHEASRGTTYTCPHGGVLSGTTCVVTSATTTPATPTTTYSCPNGGSLSGSSCVTGGSSTPATGTTTYSCSTGTLSGSSCDIAGTTTPATGTTTYSCSTGTLSGSSCDIAGTTTPATGTTTYSCPNGGSLSGATCYSTTSSSYAATPSTSYSCPPPYGGSLSGTTCSYQTSYAATVTYSCPSGGTLSGSTCGAYSAGGGTTYPATANYSCPSGGNSNGSGSCVVTHTYGAAATITYSCPSGGSLSGSSCITTSSSNYAATPNTSYSCSSGTLSGSSCVTAGTTSPATPKTTYSCSSGTLSGSSCVIGGTTHPATPATTYSCATGTLSGNTCKVSASYPAVSSSAAGYTASSIATDGTVFTATSDVSQADAQDKANAEVTKYDLAHPTSVAIPPVVAIAPHGIPVSVSIKVSHAPNGAKGRAVITQFGPIQVGAGACKSVSPGRFESATHTSYIENVTGSASGIVTLSPPKSPGCYSWGVTVTYAGGTKVSLAPSGKISTFVTPSPLGAARIAAPAINALLPIRHVATEAAALHQSAAIKTVAEWNAAAISAKSGTVVLAGRTLASGRGSGPLIKAASLRVASLIYVPTVTGKVTTWVVTKVQTLKPSVKTAKTLASFFSKSGAHRLVLMSVDGKANAHGAYPLWVVVTAREV